MTAFTYTTPTVGGSEDTWGTILNANWTALGNFIGSLDSTELAVLDGITATTAELNLLDGVTASTAELNLLDGVTATTAELNRLDGITATTAEINYVDGVTSPIQAQINAKAQINSPAFTGNPTAPTPATSDNDTTIATTAMVRAAIASYSVPSSAQVAAATAGISAGSVGSYSFAEEQASNVPYRAIGSTIAGSLLQPCSIFEIGQGGYGYLSGTWRLMASYVITTSANDFPISLWLRVS